MDAGDPEWPPLLIRSRENLEVFDRVQVALREILTSGHSRCTLPRMLEQFIQKYFLLEIEDDGVERTRGLKIGAGLVIDLLEEASTCSFAEVSSLLEGYATTVLGENGAFAVFAERIQQLEVQDQVRADAIWYTTMSEACQLFGPIFKPTGPQERSRRYLDGLTKAIHLASRRAFRESTQDRLPVPLEARQRRSPVPEERHRPRSTFKAADVPVLTREAQNSPLAIQQWEANARDYFARTLFDGPVSAAVSHLAAAVEGSKNELHLDSLHAFRMELREKDSVDAVYKAIQDKFYASDVTGHYLGLLDTLKMWKSEDVRDYLSRAETIVRAGLHVEPAAYDARTLRTIRRGLTPRLHSALEDQALRSGVTCSSFTFEQMRSHLVSFQKNCQEAASDRRGISPPVPVSLPLVTSSRSSGPQTPSQARSQQQLLSKSDLCTWEGHKPGQNINHSYAECRARIRAASPGPNGFRPVSPRPTPSGSTQGNSHRASTTPAQPEEGRRPPPANSGNSRFSPYPWRDRNAPVRFSPPGVNPMLNNMNTNTAEEVGAEPRHDDAELLLQQLEFEERVEAFEADPASNEQ